MKIKKIYPLLIAIAVCLIFKIMSVNLSDDNLKDFFNALAVSIPGSILVFNILKNKQRNEGK
ncbi:TPA: hypothetical protein ACGO5X_002060 [Streptococcus suis]|nr:hypothetical protein [Streptococcus suis]